MLDASTFVASRSEAKSTVAWVWSVPLRCTASTERQLWALLDQCETARAARLATHDQRRRFVVSHGVLRLALSAFTGYDPRTIRMFTGESGKPYVANWKPHFSLSHSGDAALLAVTCTGPIGVDVERIRADIGIQAFAHGLLDARDVARIESLPPDVRLRAWFQAWTRLEAMAKATGEGLREKPFIAPLAFRSWDLDVDELHVGSVATEPAVARIVYEVLHDVSAARSRFGSD